MLFKVLDNIFMQNKHVHYMDMQIKQMNSYSEDQKSINIS